MTNNEKEASIEARPTKNAWSDDGAKKDEQGDEGLEFQRCLEPLQPRPTSPWTT